jgi:phosphoribosylformylglycinamidine synthase
MGFDNVAGVRVGKHIRLTVDAADESAATAQVTEMATRVLSNPVIEEFEISQVPQA